MLVSIRQKQAVKSSFLAVALGLLLCGCFRGPREDIVATVGDHVLTKAMMAEHAGVPFDSLSMNAKHRLAQGWVEETLLFFEARRRGLHKKPEVERKLDELRRQLLRSRLLQEMQPQDIPNDSVVLSYYKEHKREFVRAWEEYEIELYWAPDRVTAELFRRAALNDIELAEMAHPDVTMEGIWQASVEDFEPDEATELAKLTPGQFTNPRPSEEGYRLLRLREHLPAGQPVPVEDVRHEIRERLMLEASRTALEALMTELSRNYSVTYNLGDSL